MSNEENNKNNEDKPPHSPRSPGSSPFASPRSDVSNNSPRFEQFIKGMRIPTSNTTTPSADSFIAG